MKDEYNSIREEGEVEIRIQRSTFLGFSFPLIEEPNKILQRIRNNHPSATHYCWAYRKLPSHEYFSDGGEPPNSAGRPILNALREFDLWDSMIVVVRYFGGIKLGVKGLISAYYLTSKSAIESGGIIKKIKTLDYNIVVPYEYFSQVKGEIFKNFSSDIEEEFLEKVILKIKIPEKKKEEFEKYMLGKEGMGIVRRL